MSAPLRVGLVGFHVGRDSGGILDFGCVVRVAEKVLERCSHGVTTCNRTIRCDFVHNREHALCFVVCLKTSDRLSVEWSRRGELRNSAYQHCAVGRGIRAAEVGAGL